MPMNVIAEEEGQLLLTVCRVVERIDVERDLPRRLVERGDEQIDQDSLESCHDLMPTAFSNHEWGERPAGDRREDDSGQVEKSTTAVLQPPVWWCVARK